MLCKSWSVGERNSTIALGLLRWYVMTWELLRHSHLFALIQFFVHLYTIFIYSFSIAFLVEVTEMRFSGWGRVIPNFARWSAFSFPKKPMWLGIDCKTITHPFFKILERCLWHCTLECTVSLYRESTKNTPLRLFRLFPQLSNSGRPLVTKIAFLHDLCILVSEIIPNIDGRDLTDY